MAPLVEGVCDEGYEVFRDMFARNLEEGRDIGASLHLTLEGETIVDLWGGHADAEKTRAWQRDQLPCVYSTSKIPTIILTLMAVDRGLLQLDEPVARYWPEFAQHGKDDITVRLALTHRAKVPGFREQVPAEKYCDWDYVVGRVAAEKPWFDEDVICYHGFNYGFLLGEMVQRVTGKPLVQFQEEELTGPLRADYFLGVPNAAVDARTVPLIGAKAAPHDPDNPIADAVFHSVSEPIESDFWFTAQKDAINPAGGGYASAAGLSRIATMMANGGSLDGREYLSEAIIQEAQSEQFHGEDAMLGDLRIGLGFGLDGSAFPAPTPESFHWGGYGGSWCFMDTTRRLAGAFVMNKAFVFEEWGEPTDTRLLNYWSTIGEIFS